MPCARRFRVRPHMRRTTHDAEETRSLGEAIGRRLGPGDVVALWGELGAGKTVAAQGICLGLGVAEPVSSPTFTLVQEYRGRLPVWHLDTYRVRHADELIDLGWEELLRGGGVVLVEWPERIAEALPEHRLDIRLQGDGDDREIELLPRGERARKLIQELP